MTRKINLSLFVSWLVGFLALFIIVASSAQAGRYELEKGKGVEVCEAYGKSLASPPSATGYLRASHPSFPELSGFSKPKLERLDWQKRGGLMGKVDNFLWERDANPAHYLSEAQRRDWRGTPAQWARARPGYDDYRSHKVSVNYELTRLDIDNDGTVDNVYVDQPAPPYGRLLLVLNADQTDLDYEKTKLVMVHPSRKEQGLGITRPVKKGDWGISPDAISRGYTLVEDSLHYAHYDLFRYKDKVYFDLWWSRHPDYKGKWDEEVGRLRVYTIDQQQTHEVCSYRFDSQAK